MKLSILALLALFPISAQADATRVHDLVVERLGYMESVAIWKWNKGLAVEDLDREAVVLDRAVAEAAEFNLPESAISRFYAAQIAAAKAVQFCWVDRYRTGDALPRPSPPDLLEEVRPMLLDLGAQITAAISESLGDPNLGDIDSMAVAAQELDCLDAWHLSELAESLAEIYER